MLIDYEFIAEEIIVVNEVYYYIVPEDQVLFNEDMDFMPVLPDEIENCIFYFCGRWYTHKDGEDVTMKEFRYIGKAKQNLPTKSFLAVHSAQELMNGIGTYKQWVEKAKFLGVETLGLMEHKTLRGALMFQNTCKANGIKPILGLSIPIAYEDTDFNVKLYVKDFQGWQNLLFFNTLLNVEGKNLISIEELTEHLEGLFLVIDPKTTPFNVALDILPTDYYQLETVEFMNADDDKEFLKNFEKYLRSELSPISITDAYYLEKSDFEIREVLWLMNKSFDSKTNNQYFKSKDQYASEFINMFESENQEHWVKIYKEAVANEIYLIQNCNFTYDTDTRHLPKYEMTKEEKLQYFDNEDLFIGLIKKGFAERNIKDSERYIDRLKTEIDVLKQGDVIDYFLSLHDIIRYAKSENMLTGIGRGSAGGSLVAYLLGIIQVDPLDFDLFFERFLNSGRMGEYEDRPCFTFESDEGAEITIPEGAIVKVLRDGKERNVFVQDVIEGDEILKY